MTVERFDFEGETTSRHKISLTMTWFSSSTWGLSIWIICDSLRSGCMQHRSGEETADALEYQGLTQHGVGGMIMPMLMDESST